MVTTRIYTVLLAVMLLVALPTEVIPGNAMRTMRNAVRSLTGYPALSPQDFLDAVLDGNLAVAQAMTSGMSVGQIMALYRVALESGYAIDRVWHALRNNTNNPLLQALSQEFLNAVDAVLDGNLAIVQAMTFGMSEVQRAALLMIATKYRCLPIIRYLIEHGAGRMATFEYFMTELNDAIQSNDMIIMQLLVAGASQAEKDVALECALRMNYQPFVRYLLEHGADMYIVSPELREQIFADSITQINSVVHHNDNVIAIDIAFLSQAAKKTALSRAIKNYDLAVVQYLVEQGTDIHSHSEWALRYAAEEARWDIARYLLQQVVVLDPVHCLTEEQITSIAMSRRAVAG